MDERSCGNKNRQAKNYMRSIYIQLEGLGAIVRLPKCKKCLIRELKPSCEEAILTLNLGLSTESGCKIRCFDACETLRNRQRSAPSA